MYVNLALLKIQERERKKQEKTDLKQMQLETEIDKQNKIIKHYNEQKVYFQQNLAFQKNPKRILTNKEYLFRIQTKIDDAKRKKYIAEIQLEQITADN